jgi:hypothetical protein
MAGIYGRSGTRFNRWRVDVHTVRQAIQEWHNGKHGSAVKGFFKREWPVLSFIVCFSLIAIALINVENYQQDLRDATVSGCERQNEVRAALRDVLSDDIANLRTIEPRLFPEITTAEFSLLREQRIQDMLESRENIGDADCEAVYPD